MDLNHFAKRCFQKAVYPNARSRKIARCENFTIGVARGRLGNLRAKAHEIIAPTSIESMAEFKAMRPRTSQFGCID